MDADAAHELKFRAEAERRRALGIVLLLVAGVLWLWAVGWLLVPVDGGPDSDCRSPALAFDDENLDPDCRAGNEVGFPVLLLALGLPLAAFGAMFLGAATTRLRMIDYHASMPGLAGAQRLEHEGRRAGERLREDRRPAQDA